jgi:hypothetical protein
MKARMLERIHSEVLAELPEEYLEIQEEAWSNYNGDLREDCEAVSFENIEIPCIGI